MAHPAVAVLEYHLVSYRRVWRSTAVSALTMPLLLFLGMGVAVGSYVDRGSPLGVPYLQFIAPGLLAAAGLQLAMTEAGFPVVGHFKWNKIYFSITAAPPRVTDLIVGRLGYIALRVALAVSAFLLIMLPFGAVGSAWAAITPAVAVLAGLAAAAPMLAYAASVNSANMMAAMFRFATLPMTLFSGVFFPLEQLPAVLRPLAHALPLWHGVELCRAATLGSATAWPVPVHIGILCLWLVAGFALARARFAKRLAV